jgi:hypothetical protein
MSTRAPPNKGTARWLLAQEFILEQSGRVSGMGLFMADIVQIQMPAEAPEPTVNAPIRVDNLAVLFSSPGFTGRREFRVTLESPRGIKAATTVTTKDLPKATDSHSLILKLSPLLLQGFGTFKLTAECESLGLSSSFHFQIVRSLPESHQNVEERGQAAKVIEAPQRKPAARARKSTTQNTK